MLMFPCYRLLWITLANKSRAVQSQHEDAKISLSLAAR